MNPTDTPPCPDCGGQLTEHGPDNDSNRNAYDCASCGWGWLDRDEPLTVATAPWTREVWAGVEAARSERDRLRRILAVERGDQGAAPEGWHRVSARRWGRESRRYCSAVDRFEGAGKTEWRFHFGTTPPGPMGPYPSALEAMEAADRAAKETP